MAGVAVTVAVTVTATVTVAVSVRVRVRVSKKIQHHSRQCGKGETRRDAGSNPSMGRIQKHQTHSSTSRGALTWPARASASALTWPTWL